MKELRVHQHRRAPLPTPPSTLHSARTRYSYITRRVASCGDLSQAPDSHRIHPDVLMHAFIRGRGKAAPPLTNFLLLARFPSLGIDPESRRM